MNKELDTSVIPKGMYCYTPLGEFVNGCMQIKTCPYWKINPSKPQQESGYCHYLEAGDWMENGTWLLWDQIKCCDINLEIEDECET